MNILFVSLSIWKSDVGYRKKKKQGEEGIFF